MSASPDQRTPRIGIFDSGVGGLSVLAALRRLLPGAELVYLADTAWAPYGERSDTEIRERSHVAAGLLGAHRPDALVVACNTATAAALESLRGTLSLPVIGMEPAVRPARAATRNGRVGVLATAGTLASARFAGLLERYARGIEVVVEPAPRLVSLAEAGRLDDREVRSVIAEHAERLLDAGVDTVVLGCTHFPLFRPLLAEALPAPVSLIDTADAVARQTLRRLPTAPSAATDDGHVRLLATGRDQPLLELARSLLGADALIRVQPAGQPV